MRIIKLGEKVELVRVGGFVPYYFDGNVAFYMGPNGEFEFKKKIRMGGIAPGEWLVFSYAARIAYVAVAKTEVFEKKDGDRFFCIDKTSIRKGNGLPLQTLRQELENAGVAESLHGQPWNPIDIDDKRAKRVLQKFVDGKAPLIKGDKSASQTRDGSAGRKGSDSAELPGRADVTISRIIRDNGLSRYIKERNDYACQLCETSLDMPGGKKYAEAHHIQPLGKGGRDIPENMICVCPNCHALLDYRAIKLPDAADIGGVHVIEPDYIRYHNREVDKS